MDIYLSAEKTLAELLGYFYEDYQCDNNYQWYDKYANPVKFIRYTQNDSEVFKLMVEHSVDIEQWAQSVRAIYFTGNDGCKTLKVSYDDHPDKATAIRFAIVQAVIDKLKG